MLPSRTAVGWIILASLTTTAGLSNVSAYESESTTRLAADLRREVRADFDRGLMSLPDFLEHLAVVEVARMRELKIDNEARPWPEMNSKKVEQALMPRLSDLRTAVARLTAFRQPAAAGYEADVALAEYALYDAELQAAYLTGASAAIPRLSRERQQTAEEHYRRRLFDYKHLGHASLPSLVEATAMLNILPRWQTQIRGRADQQTRAWFTAGAGIGRQDLVQSSALGLMLTHEKLAESQDQFESEATLLLRADQTARELHATQLKYYATGTASLSDLTRSWQWRWQLQSRAALHDIPLPETAQRSLDAELATLVRLAGQVTDQRGRMRADILRVRLLQELRTQ